MSWWGVVPGALLLVLLVLVPGAAMLRLVGVRGLAVIGAGPAVTLGVLGAAALGYAPAGIPWTLASALAALGVGVGAAWGLGRLARGRGAAPGGALPGVAAAPFGWRAALATAGALVAACVLLGAPLVSGMGAADAPLQQWDAVFHLNAVATIRETGVATPLGALAPLYGSGTIAPYYPTGWHALVAVAPGLPAVPAAANVSTLVLGVVVWLTGLTALAREVFARSELPAVLAPLLGATFVAFPVVQLTVLAQWPNGLSTALLPAALVLCVRAVRALEAGPGTGWGRGTAVLAALAAVAGVVSAHASGMFAVVVLAGPLVLGVLARWIAATARSGRPVLAAVVAAGLAAGLVGTPVAVANLEVFAGVVGFDRGSGLSHAAAAGQVLLDQTLAHTYAGDGVAHLFVTLATLAGLVAVLLTRKNRWLGVGYLLAVALAVLAAGPENPLRWLAGFWYTQAGRIAPVAVVPAVLLAAYAADLLVRGLRERRGRRAARVVTAAVLVVVVATAVIRMPLQRAVTESAYVPGELAWGTMATTEELAMIERTEQTLPRDAVVVGDPFNGSALLPALAGRDVIFPQLGTSGMSPEQSYVEENLGRIHDDPRVCEALAALGASHLYQDTATAQDGAKTDARTLAMRDVDTSRGFELVERAGSASLYRITACG